MAVSLKELTHKESYLARGHSACAGCAGPVVIRQIMLAAAEHPLVVTFATGCMEVVSTLYPYTAWKCSYIHNAFENSAATLSGIETAFRKLKEQDKVSGDYRFIAFGGDGGTYDIGFQSLSGTMERGHRLLYVCYDNQAYMNTVIQRSSATPKGAWTNTSPVGTVGKGKEQVVQVYSLITLMEMVVVVGMQQVHQLQIPEAAVEMDQWDQQAVRMETVMRAQAD